MQVRERLTLKADSCGRFVCRIFHAFTPSHLRTTSTMLITAPANQLKMKHLALLALTSLATSLLSVSGVAQTPTFAWGENSHGQSTVTPVPIPGMTYTQVSAGRWHSAACRNDGVAVAWGRNDAGQCNVTAAPQGVDYVKVSAGGWHTLALRSDGIVSAWGRNTDGQCNVPALPTGMSYVQISAGGFHSIALRSDGALIAWGQNHDGQTNVPALPSGLVYDGIATGMLHTLARRSDGEVIAWGRNTFGQTNVPPTPTGVTNVEVAAGQFHSLALRSDGSLVAWGSNSDGQTNVPTLPSGLTYTQIDAGAAHTVALGSNGSIYAWGRNWEGQCNVPGNRTYIDVRAGGNHTIARGDSMTAAVNLFGNGCPSTNPLALNSNLPMLGSSWVLSTSAAELSSSLSVFWIGDSAIVPGYDLGFIGAAGCVAYTNANLYVAVEPTSGGTSLHAIPVPNALSLVGIHLTAQATAESSATLIGFTTSNGLSATLGY